MRKRGAIELQFNWVFTLIVGAAIFVFFFGIINRYTNIAASTTSANIINDLETITTGASVSRGTVQTIRLPNVDITFDCADCFCHYSIRGVSKQFRDKIIFAPSLIKGRNLIAWTLDWSSPFRVTNLLYLTSPYIRYIIVGNSNLALEINSTLPSELDRDYNATFPGSSIQDENNYKVRFVYVDVLPQNNDLANLVSMKDDDVTAISIDSSANPPKIDFYKKQGSVWSSSISTTYFTNTEDVIAAIFSEDADTYNCNMQSLYGRMAKVTRIYINRTYFFYTNPPSGCASTLYDMTALTTLESKSLILAQQFPPTNLNDLRDIITQTATLSTQNTRTQLWSCPEIY